MRRVLRMGLVAVTVAVVCAPVQASAKSYINPWTGLIFGRDQAPAGFKSFGASFGDAGGTFWGTETNIGLTPAFFGNGVENYVMEIMGGITLGPSWDAVRKNIRPYAALNVGIIRSSIDSKGVGVQKFARNDLGVSIGGGLTIDLNDRLGLQGDLRSFRGLNSEPAVNELKANLGNLHYWRAAIGIFLH